jgi:TonB family protein
MLAALMLASFIATRRSFDPGSLPPIELVSLENVRITDGVGAGGGTPTPPPTAPAPPPSRPLDPPIRRVDPPVHETPRPPVTAPRPERRVEVTADVKKAQDVDRTAKGATSQEKPEPEKRQRKIEVAKATSRPSAKELEAERRAAEAERRATEAAEARRAAAEAAKAAKAAQERWTKAVGGIHSKLSENLSGETTITVPGPGGGGEVWIGYATYLKSFYEVRWRRPSSLPAPVAYVGVSITVARDGRLLHAEVLDKSGIRELDASVNEVIQRHRQLEPLPPGSTDSERTFRIKFRLEGGTQ